ncbi:MAG TPA: PilZ domain-containing protein [Nitrospiraceae bacterium]|jgi:c-di-GMP-binding flagellar brake protein YcgR|nr:PilZ domain-containing protein [Nitrospiraceae bacterium]
MKPRTSERFPHRIRVEFSALDASVEGKGMITDLSKGGCCVESNTLAPKGTELQVSLFMPDYTWPMKVERAIVRWVKRTTFGVEFLTVQSSHRERLSRFIMKLKEEAGY